MGPELAVVHGYGDGDHEDGLAEADRPENNGRDTGNVSEKGIMVRHNGAERLGRWLWRR